MARCIITSYFVPDVHEAIVMMPLGSRPLSVDGEAGKIRVHVIHEQSDAEHVPHQFHSFVPIIGDIPPDHGEFIGRVTFPVAVESLGFISHTERFVFFAGRIFEDVPVFEDDLCSCQFHRVGKTIRLGIREKAKTVCAPGKYAPNELVHLGILGMKTAAELVVAMFVDGNLDPRLNLLATSFCAQDPQGPQIPRFA